MGKGLLSLHPLHFSNQKLLRKALFVPLWGEKTYIGIRQMCIFSMGNVILPWIHFWLREWRRLKSLLLWSSSELGSCMASEFNKNTMCSREQLGDAGFLQADSSLLQHSILPQSHLLWQPYSTEWGVLNIQFWRCVKTAPACFLINGYMELPDMKPDHWSVRVSIVYWLAAAFQGLW